MKFDQKLIGKAFAEYVGTFALAAVVIVMAQTIGQPFLTGIAAALVLTTFVSTVGPVSGSHLNPAVTLGLYSLRKIKSIDAIVYIVFQFLGALSALRLVEYMFAQKISGTNFEGEFDMKIFLAEAIGTAVFTFGIASVVNRKVEGYQASAAIGASLFIGIMIASMSSSGVLNPALAFGAKTFNLNYAFGPLVGSLLAMNLHNLIIGTTESGGMKFNFKISKLTETAVVSKAKSKSSRTASRKRSGRK